MKITGLMFVLWTSLLLVAHAEELSILQEQGILNAKKTMPSTSKPQTVPEFSYIDSEGKPHLFGEHRGKWVIVNYWAIYCPPCRVEVTDIDMFARDNKTRAIVLGMDAGGSEIQELNAFKQEFNLSYPMIPAQRSTLLAFGVVNAIPTTFVVSPEGHIITKHVGLITYDDLNEIVTERNSIKSKHN